MPLATVKLDRVDTRSTSPTSAAGELAPPTVWTVWATLHLVVCGVRETTVFAPTAAHSICVNYAHSRSSCTDDQGLTRECGRRPFLLSDLDNPRQSSMHNGRAPWNVPTGTLHTGLRVVFLQELCSGNPEFD